LRPLLDRLLAAPKHPRAEHQRGSIPDRPGVYLFSSADGWPVYVGQSRRVRTRLAEHCRENADHNSASFAYNIAKKNAMKADIILAGSRAEVSVHADFVEHFRAAKLLVAQMPVQFVTEGDAALRTVFEVYATYALGTHEYNTFETH